MAPITTGTNTRVGGPAAPAGGAGAGRVGLRVLFLITVAAALVLLPMRHAIVVTAPVGRPVTRRPAEPLAFAGGDNPNHDAHDGGVAGASKGGGSSVLVPTSNTSNDNNKGAAGSPPLDGGSDADASTTAAAGPIVAFTPTPTGPAEPVSAEERQKLLDELRVNPDQLPRPRPNDSQQAPVELGHADAGGLYRNPYPAMERSARPCTDGRHARGRWVLDPARKAPYPGVGEILGSCQRGWEAKHGPGAQRPETRYRWVPDTCDLIPFSEEKFCRALRGRDIMFAGDSLNDHWHASLLYLLGVSRGRDIYHKEGTVQRKRACQTHAICSKFYARPLKLYFLTNQLLQQTSMRNRNHKWWKHIRQYSLLVLNAGSWMRDPTNEEREVSDSEYEGHMRHALKLVRALFNGTVVWRTTYQGHPYCWRYEAPLTEELSAGDFPTVPPYKRYRWAAIPGRNRYATALWREAGAHVLDITRPTNLMPLGHLGQNHPKFALRNTTDCLHYCAPGPYDTWSELLMNLLLGNVGP